MDMFEPAQIAVRQPRQYEEEISDIIYKLQKASPIIGCPIKMLAYPMIAWGFAPIWAPLIAPNL